MKEIFRNQVYRKEFLRFVTEGLLIAFVFGAMLGFLDILLKLTNVMTILTYFTSFIFYLFFNRRIFRTFSAYFKIYSILAVIFIFLGFYVMRVSGLIALTLLPNGLPFSTLYFNPVYAFALHNWSGLVNILVNVVNILFYVIIGILTFRNMKRVM